MYSPAVSQCVRSVRDPRGCSLGSSVAGGRYRRFSMDADNHWRGTQEGRGRLGVPFCLGRYAREIGHMTHDDSLATVSLVSRIHSEGVQPLRASEFWKLCEQIAQPGMLLGQTETHLLREHDLSAELSARVVALLDRARAMAFELEQLDQAGIWTLTPYRNRSHQGLERTAHQSLHRAARTPPPAAVRSTTTQGGNLQKARRPKAAKARPRSEGSRMALVQSGS